VCRVGCPIPLLNRDKPVHGAAQTRWSEWRSSPLPARREVFQLSVVGIDWTGPSRDST
jgi:hypothetical protein